MMIVQLALSFGTLTIRYLTPANLGKMSLRVEPLGISLIRTLFNLTIHLGDQHKAVTLLMSHQHLGVL